VRECVGSRGSANTYQVSRGPPTKRRGAPQARAEKKALKRAEKEARAAEKSKHRLNGHSNGVDLNGKSLNGKSRNGHGGKFQGGKAIVLKSGVAAKRRARQGRELGAPL